MPGKRSTHGIDCGSATARYCRRRLAPPSRFDPRSFRTIRRGAALITIACPKGKWRVKAQRCSVGTRAQSIAFLKSDPHCRVCRRRA
jgi:hypothetical protein